jgi:hypothetical protein
LQCTHQKIVPTSSLDGKTIEFNLERFDAANVYLIQETYCEVTIKITKNDGLTLPDTSQLVGPVNNILHSLFEAVRLTINDIPISVSPGNYPYKAYITNCLTYPTIVKSSHLQTQGWYTDLSAHMGPSLSNSGFTERSQLFREKFNARNSYRADGATFFGRLLHDLVSCETGLPPQTKCKIELDRSDDAFFLMVANNDTEKFKFKITNMCLFVPVAQLSMPVFQEINSLMTRKSEPKPISIHYRRIEVRPISLANGKEEYYSDSLFSDADLPCRIIICFVETSSKIGTYSTNPFEFRVK